MAGPDEDVLIGGEGDDVLDGGSEFDRLEETGDMDFLLTTTTLSGLGSDTFIGIDAAGLMGGPSDNVIDASAFALGGVFLTSYGGDAVLWAPRPETAWREVEAMTTSWAGVLRTVSS